VEWGICVAGAVLAAGLGYVGGYGAVLTDRRRRPAEPDGPPAQSEFRLEHVDGLTWLLVNVGSAAGTLVSLLPFADGLEQWPPHPVAGRIESATSELLPTLRPGESMSVWLSRYDTGQQVVVSWTSDGNVRMGPVRLDVPPPA
jgi:hypothetical protein